MVWWLRWHARRFFRSVMKPIPPLTAAKWERRMRFLYIWFSWNAMLLCIYLYKKDKEKNDRFRGVDDLTPAHRKARYMGLENHTIYRVHLFGDQPTEQYHYKHDEYMTDLKRREELARREWHERIRAKEREREATKGSDAEGTDGRGDHVAYS